MKKLSVLVIGLSLLIAGKSFAQSVAGAPNHGMPDLDYKGSGSSNSTPASVARPAYKATFNFEPTGNSSSVKTTVFIWKGNSLQCPSSSKPIELKADNDALPFLGKCEENNIRLKLIDSSGKKWLYINVTTENKNDKPLINETVEVKLSDKFIRTPAVE